MKCEQFQELILTDYLDEQLTPGRKTAVEGHLSSCKDCRQLAEAARKLAVEPFRNAGKVTLSQEEIWLKVKDKILSETPAHRTNPVTDFLERLKDLLAVPKPAFGAAMAMVMVLIAWLFVVTFRQPEQYVRVPAPEETTQSIAYVIDEITGEDDANGGYGTAIEEYFL
jgi:anti-sigma factor RsiW